jgi:hypothetical protein
MKEICNDKKQPKNLKSGRNITMKEKLKLYLILMAVVVTTTLTLGIFCFAFAHCDTLDGPVIQDARKALNAKDVTPVLKWVKQKDEKAVHAAFSRAQSAKGMKNAEAAENQFFATLVKIHRAGEGASFTGLKPEGEVEPAIAEADKALVSGSPDALIKMVTDDVAAGIKKRFDHAAATYKNKDESVEQGREFVGAYVEYTHYVERLHLDATVKGMHGGHHEGFKPPAAKHDATKEHKHQH